MKVVSVRIDEKLEKEILDVMWWENYITKTEALRVLLKLGIRTWKHKKYLNPFKRVYVETRQNQASKTETSKFHT